MANTIIKNKHLYGYDPEQKKYVTLGHYDGKVFIKRVSEINFMRVIGGYGIQYANFSEFDELGIKDICVIERHTANKWWATMNTWKTHGRIADYGRGKQIFLSLKYMKLEKPDQPNQKLSVFEAIRKSKTQEPEHIQSELFD